MPRAGSTYDAAWDRLRPTILRRDNYLCQVRGPGCRGKATAVDHVVPVNAGGARLDPRNLRAICVTCNTRRAKNPDAYRTPRIPSREW